MAAGSRCWYGIGSNPTKAVSNTPFYTRTLPAGDAAPLAVRLKNVAAGRYRLTVHRTGYLKNDAMSHYIDMGRPENLTDAQLARLRAATTDAAEQERIVKVAADGTLDLTWRCAATTWCC